MVARENGVFLHLVDLTNTKPCDFVLTVRRCLLGEKMAKKSTKELEELQDQIIRYRTAGKNLTVSPDVILELLNEVLHRRRMGYTSWPNRKANKK